MVRILLSTRLGKRRWTQADLARMTGIRPNTIRELYNEVATRISLDHLFDCADAEQRATGENRTGAPRSKGED